MAAALAAEGHSVFRRDPDDPGADAPYADAVIVVWSPEAIKNSATVEAARKALARRILVPVAIGDVAPPSSFAHLWPIDLADWRGDCDDPRWQFVRDEISLAMRRNEFAPPIADARPPRSRRSFPEIFSRALPVLLGGGVLAAAAAVVMIFIAPPAGPALRAADSLSKGGAASRRRSHRRLRRTAPLFRRSETAFAEDDDLAGESGPADQKVG